MVGENVVKVLILNRTRNDHSLAIIVREVGLLQSDGDHLSARYYEPSKINGVTTMHFKLAAFEHLVIYVRVDGHVDFILVVMNVISVERIDQVVQFDSFLSDFDLLDLI